MRPSRILPPALLTAVLALGLMPSGVWAHHVMGIPQYKYGDEDPDTPYMEVIAQLGKYDLDFIQFPGFATAGEKVRFTLRIQRRDTGALFKDPIRVDVLCKQLLSEGMPEAGPFEVRAESGPERDLYEFFFEFDAPETYEVRVLFPTSRGDEVIPFPVTIGEKDDRPIIFGAMGILVGAVITVALVRVMRRGAPMRRVERSA